MRRLLAIGVIVGLTGCSSILPPSVPPPCNSDDECESGQICFPDGCGDPGKNLFLEVTANTRTGQHAQDFSIADGTLRPTYDVDLFPPMSLTGEVNRDGTIDGDPQQRTLYTEPFSVRATGESALIPGVVRSFEQAFTRPERGAFAMPIAAGRYTVTTTAADSSIPPLARTGVQVDNGTNSQVSFTFPSIDGTLILTGRLLEHIEAGVPPVEIPLTQAQMELEVVDPVTHRPLSQRTFTSSGLTGSKGDFVLSIDPAAKLLGSFQIIARPRDAAALVPTRTFTINRPFPTNRLLTLEMGDFGDPLSGLIGEVVGTDGAPVVGASVFFEGLVAGGGTFRSRTVITDPTGHFRVDLLPSIFEGAYTMTVLPLAKSEAGILTVAAQAMPRPGYDPVLEPARFICPDKLLVVGTLARPDDAVASQVVVLATAVKSIDGRPVPTEPTEAITDESGRFKFSLDPAVYRLDFSPGENLPRMSRYVTVRAEGSSADAQAVAKTIDLKGFTLSKGRRVTGHVNSLPFAGAAAVDAVNATLRFFRLTTVDNKPGAQLLGEAVTDDLGNYGVVLPGS